MLQQMERRSQFQPLLLFLFSIPDLAFAFGSTGPIAAAFGDTFGFFCAIQASGKQEIICWEKNGTSPSAQEHFSSVPPMAVLSGGEGFMCGLHAETSFPYCWNSRNSGTDLVPVSFRNSAYSRIAAGKNHICAVRGSYYYSSSEDFGSVDCWVVNGSYSSLSSLFNLPTESLAFGDIVSGEGFTCGVAREQGFLCWGPDSKKLGISAVSENLLSLSSGRNSVCAILRDSGEVKCWGDAASYNHLPSADTRFISLSTGSRHFCGIRENDHGIQCWGTYNTSSVPKGSGFLAIASSDFATCGVREDDLILDCWGGGGLSSSSLLLDYNPPLQLCSPGPCTEGRCGEGEFTFNASALNVPDLASLCVLNGLRICSPCGFNCSEGFFPSSSCGENVDRVCTPCSLCQNSTCRDICGFSDSDSLEAKQRNWVKKLVIAIGCSVLGCSAFVLIGWCFLPRVIFRREGRKGPGKSQCTLCVGNVERDADNIRDPPPMCSVPIVETQVFRLSELKDATNGFKEFNELGRGSYGFVYKAILSDGQQVAVKRASAATRIHSNSRDFEADLEILCKVRHCNLVNLLGYCSEMGERLLVYEFMPHGTLHDHLHGGLSPLDWNLRLKICMQAAKGLEYLHKDAVPPIVHRDIKSSNVLLDSDWVARVADFGLLSNGDRALNEESVYVDPGYYKTQLFTEKSDVYSFGIVLLEILSGRTVYDKDYNPPSIVEWAAPLIRQRKAAAIVDQNIGLPRNVEPILRLADIAELTVRENPQERPVMSDVAVRLEQIFKSSCTL